MTTDLRFGQGKALSLDAKTTVIRTHTGQRQCLTPPATPTVTVYSPGSTRWLPAASTSASAAPSESTHSLTPRCPPNRKPAPEDQRGSAPHGERACCTGFGSYLFELHKLHDRRRANWMGEAGGEEERSDERGARR